MCCCLLAHIVVILLFFFFQAEDGIRDLIVTGVQTCALPIFWEELADKFRLLVDLLNEVSERTLASTDAGLIRLYERWMKTGSERLAAVLVRQGVVPRRGVVQ